MVSEILRKYGSSARISDPFVIGKCTTDIPWRLTILVWVPISFVEVETVAAKLVGLSEASDSDVVWATSLADCDLNVTIYGGSEKN